MERHINFAAKISNAAYASLFMKEHTRINKNMLISQQVACPIILPKSDYFSSFFKESAIYVEPNEKDISKAMILVYKDENYRNLLIEKGLSEMKKNTWIDVAHNLWEVMTNIS